METETRFQEDKNMIIGDFIISALVIVLIFLMGYMAYRQQSMLETFREFKEMFEDKIEVAKESTGIYQ